MNNKTKGHLALLGTNVFFAINFTAVKYLIDDGMVKPFGLNFIRMTVACLMLWAMYFLKKEKEKISFKDIGRLILCALTGIVINQLLFIKGLSLTIPIHASLLMLFTPILITFISVWALKEKLSYNTLAGILLGVCGASILVASRKSGSSGKDIMLGDFLVLVNAVSYSIYFIIVKPLMNKYHPITTIRMLFTIGLFISIPFCWNEFIQTPIVNYDAGAWTALLLITIGGTFFAYTFNIYGIKVLGSTIAGAYIYTQPFMATAIAIMMGKDSLESYKLIAAVFIFLGLYLASKNKKNA